MWTINTDVFLAHFGSSFDHKRFIIHLAINQQITQPTYAASNTTDYHNSSKTLTTVLNFTSQKADRTIEES